MILALKLWRERASERERSGNLSMINDDEKCERERERE